MSHVLGTALGWGVWVLMVAKVLRFAHFHNTY